MAVHRLDLALRHTRQDHELEADRHEIFADDVEARLRHQVMDVGDATGQRILDRDHRQIRIAAFHRVERVFKRLARQGRHVGKHVAGRHVGIGAEVALEGDAVGSCDHGSLCSLHARGQHAARLFKIGWRIHAKGNGMDDFRIDAHAGFQRAQLLKLLAHFKHGGRQRHEALQRFAAIGVEADMWWRPWGGALSPIRPTARWRG